MKNFSFLIVFFQIFHVFGQFNPHDRLSARSSAPDKVSSTPFVKRETTKEKKMNCEVVDNVRRKGYASECFAAIKALYDPAYGYPSCAIFKTCVLQPLDKNQEPMGGLKDKSGQPQPPPLTLQQMNKAYHTYFSYYNPAYDYYKCEDYVLPPNVELDPDFQFEPHDMFATFILKIKSSEGQGDVPAACSPELAAKVLKEAL